MTIGRRLSLAVLAAGAGVCLAGTASAQLAPTLSDKDRSNLRCSTAFDIMLVSPLGDKPLTEGQKNGFQHFMLFYLGNIRQSQPTAPMSALMTPEVVVSVRANVMGSGPGLRRRGRHTRHRSQPSGDDRRQ